MQALGYLPDGQRRLPPPPRRQLQFRRVALAPFESFQLVPDDPLGLDYENVLTD